MLVWVSVWEIGRKVCGWSGVEDGEMMCMVYGGVFGVRLSACVGGCLGGLEGECEGDRMEGGRWSLGWR